MNDESHGILEVVDSRNCPARRGNVRRFAPLLSGAIEAYFTLASMHEPSDVVMRIPIPQLPDAVVQEARDAVRSHAVSLIACDENELEGVPCGGTFVRIGGNAGVLTARHVWESLEKRSKLILLIGGKPYRVPPADLHGFAPSAEDTLDQHGASVPDIAFIKLSPEHIGRIEAQGKSFYSIDRRVGNDQFDLYGDDGFWIVVGCPVALLDVERQAVPSFLYLTGVERTFVHASWDYSLVNLSIEDNPTIPKQFGGMSGGGLWRVQYQVTRDLKHFSFRDLSRDASLVGVTFFETGEQGRQLIAHGPRSLYEFFPPLVRSRFPL